MERGCLAGRYLAHAAQAGAILTTLNCDTARRCLNLDGLYLLRVALPNGEQQPHFSWSVFVRRGVGCVRQALHSVPLEFYEAQSIKLKTELF